MRKRLEELFEKLISFKFVCLLITIVLLVLGYIGEGTFLAVLITVIAGREGQKIAGMMTRKDDARTEAGG